MTGGGIAPPLSLPERAVRHERLIVLVLLALVAAAGLEATIWSGDRMMQIGMAGSDYVYASLIFIMWWTMMLAMMLPSAAPAIIVYAALRRNMTARFGAQPPLAVFVLGYAAVWTLFSAAATLLQIVTRNSIELTPMFATTSALLGGALLVAAGLYQFTPLKAACLRHCQTPFFYFARRWKSNARGAFALGFRHGLYCLGCCWVLMLLLFFGGVMELTWIIGLAIYVAVEKLLRNAGALRHVAGIGLVLWGAWVLAAALG